MHTHRQQTPFPDCPTTLGEDQLSAYRQQGYLAFEQALNPDEVKAARQALSDMVKRYAFNEQRAEYRPATKDGNNHAGASFWSKQSPCWIQLEPGFEPDPGDLEAVELKVRKAMYFQDEADIFRSICTNHPRIQGVIKSILGQDITLYQSMALVKPANGGVEKPWHQDNAYFCVEDLDQVLGIWIALDDATIANGCMHVLEGGHRLGPLRHFHSIDCEIVKDRIDPSQAAPIELKAGGMLVFHGNLPHQTPANQSPHRRRALQFHFRSRSNTILSTEEYFKVFKEADGTPASCMAAIPENF